MPSGRKDGRRQATTWPCRSSAATSEAVTPENVPPRTRMRRPSAMMPVTGIGDPACHQSRLPCSRSRWTNVRHERNSPCTDHRGWIVVIFPGHGKNGGWRGACRRARTKPLLGRQSGTARHVGGEPCLGRYCRAWALSGQDIRPALYAQRIRRRLVSYRRPDPSIATRLRPRHSAPSRRCRRPDWSLLQAGPTSRRRDSRCSVPPARPAQA